ncbi:phospholipase A and acyltransferase 2-like [Ptychodera flava]|uniref:phospholipase A and acyltransferase 2-like n=1 Tax=Ptychodera flava TaxID=63121 RepID=UPI00396AA569
MSALARSGSGSYGKHNQTVLDSCNPGDLLEFTRGWYSHWGVYVGDGQVVHLTGENDGIGDDIGNPQHVFSVWGKQFNKAKVKCENFWNIVYDCKAIINNDKDGSQSAASVEEIVERAFSSLGEIGYNVLWNNCEHFAKWCRYGKKESSQVNGFLTYMGIGLASVAGLMLFTKYATKEQEKEKAHKK